MLTAAPARLYGLRDRGVSARGRTPTSSCSTRHRGLAARRHALRPAGRSGALYADADGIDHVIVAGTPIVTDGDFTDARPGRVLRSGKDTATPTMQL